MLTYLLASGICLHLNILLTYSLGILAVHDFCLITSHQMCIRILNILAGQKNYFNFLTSEEYAR